MLGLDERLLPANNSQGRPGGGRKTLTETDPGLLLALEALIEPVTRRDPQSPLRWTWKSTRRPADELDLRLQVCQFPPGTSKWNRIEHRPLSFITRNWRGRPLGSHQAVVSLITTTTTQTGLIVKAVLDTKRYDTAVKVTKEQLGRLRLTPHRFHED